MTTTEPLDDLYEMAVRFVEVQQPDLAPDEDWISTLLLITSDDKVVVGALLLDSSAQQAAAVHDLIIDNDGVAIALIQTVWMIDGVDRKDMATVSPGEHPERREAVNILLADIAGRMELHQAAVERHEEAPPGLAEWAKLGGENFEGRFPHVLTRAFEKVAEHAA